MSQQAATPQSWAAYMKMLEPYVKPRHYEIALTIPGPDRELALAIAMTLRGLPEVLQQTHADLGNRSTFELLSDPEAIPVLKHQVIQIQFPKPFWTRDPFHE